MINQEGFLFLTFGMVWGNSGGEKRSFISVIEEVGRLRLFKKGSKFQRTNSFDFPSDWVGSENTYRFINDGRQLFCATGLGFCVIDVFIPAVEVRTLFGNNYTHMMTGAILSPNEKILAVTMCEWQFTDPVKDEEVYQNSLQIFDVKNGNMIGKHELDFRGSVSSSQISFSNCGSQVSLSINSRKMFFQLNASSV